MKKYRKNSTEVEAIQHNGTLETLNEIKELLPDIVKEILLYSKDME